MTSFFARRRVEWLLFCAAFVAFAWFHQGGGWNQNGRFALVRAMVERGTFFIDDYLVYVHGSAGTELRRLPVREGQLENQGDKFALAWPGRQGLLTSIEPNAPLGTALTDLRQFAATGDVAYARGHFSPNKAPGTSFVAVPAYFVLYHLDRLLGLDPDQWRVLTINAWLTGAFSIGLLAALGVVLAYLLALRLTGGDHRAALVAALALGVGSTFFPYATMLYEHDVAAVLMLAAWWCVLGAGEWRTPTRALAAAGLCAGFAAITSYIMAVAVVFVASYVAVKRRPRDLLWYGAGVLVPFVIICVYNVVCFGTPFTTNYHYENPMFMSAQAALGVFVLPNLAVLVKVLVSPYRGLFVYAPVLVMGVVGLVAMFRRREWRADAALATAMVVFILLFNTTFNGWDGGWAGGPRYLVPMLPFLAVPLALGFARLPRVTTALLVLSSAMQLVITAVDAQAPVGASGLATVPGRAQWTYNALVDYELPLMFQGRPERLLRQQEDVVMRNAERTLRGMQAPPDTVTEQLARLRKDLQQRVDSGDPEPIYLATVRGPVSANQIGMYEATFHLLFLPATTVSNWNSFNAGEFLAPRSLWSLLPLLLIEAVLLTLAWRATRRTPATHGVAGAPATP